MIEYFEMPELPGRKYFRCAPFSASMAVESCAERFKAASAPDADTRLLSCRRCLVGAAHAGKVDPNPSPLCRATVCARCHRFATRLIGKHLCISCYNRQREQLVGVNRKGSQPKKLPSLRRRTVAYQTAGQVKTKTVDLSLDTDELIVTVLRDEDRRMRFGWAPPAALARLALIGAQHVA
jgi:hypothetical protein